MLDFIILWCIISRVQHKHERGAKIEEISTNTSISAFERESDQGFSSRGFRQHCNCYGYGNIPVDSV